jgi:hypothetical protein
MFAECQQCIKERLENDEKPARLITLKNKTQRLEKSVEVCEYCDGGLLDLYLRSNEE